MKTILTIVVSVVIGAGVIAVNQLAAQTSGTSTSIVPPASTIVLQNPDVTTPTTPTTPTTTPSTGTTNGTNVSVPVTGSTVTVQNIVEITRLVPSGTTAVTAFTVPAGVVLVVTDLIVTNTGTAATCGAAVNRTGTAATPTAPTTPTTPPAAATTMPGATTTVAGTVTQTDSSVTGPLCVPAQTTTTLPLTTGIEFAAGQSVQLMNAPDSAAPAGTSPGTLGFHLRGLLVTLT